MTKSYVLVIGAMIVLASAGGAAVWFLRDKIMDAPPTFKAPDARADYEAWFNALGLDEAHARAELNDLVATASAKLSKADDVKRGRLTAECLDANVLLELDFVKEFVHKAAKKEAVAYHFVGQEQRTHLQYIVGDAPTAAQVLALRKELAKLAIEFGILRQPPTWKVELEVAKGVEPPFMPYLDLLRSASTFAPATTNPTLPREPRVPVFAGADAELLLQLEAYFNSPAALKAFPQAQFPKLYHNQRILPIPRHLAEYRAAIVQAMNVERKILLPADNPAKEAVESVDEVYAVLERFFAVIEKVQLPE